MIWNRRRVRDGRGRRISRRICSAKSPAACTTRATSSASTPSASHGASRTTQRRPSPRSCPGFSRRTRNSSPDASSPRRATARCRHYPAGRAGLPAPTAVSTTLSQDYRSRHLRAALPRRLLEGESKRHRLRRRHRAPVHHRHVREQVHGGAPPPGRRRVESLDSEYGEFSAAYHGGKILVRGTTTTARRKTGSTACSGTTLWTGRTSWSSGFLKDGTTTCAPGSSPSPPSPPSRKSAGGCCTLQNGGSSSSRRRWLQLLQQATFKLTALSSSLVSSRCWCATCLLTVGCNISSASTAKYPARR